VAFTSRVSVQIDQSGQGRRHEVDWGGYVHCPPHFCQRSFLRLMQNRWVFFRDEEGWGQSWFGVSLTLMYDHNYLGFREFAKYGEWSKFGTSVGHQKLKGFQPQGAASPLTRGSAPGLRRGLCPRPPYRLPICALAICPPHIVWPADAPESGAS